MNERPTDETPPLREVTVVVENRPMVIKPADAEQIASALQQYFNAHASTEDGVPLPRVAGLPWVDSRGTLRVGTWMLGSRGDRLVLTMRDAPQPGVRFAYQFMGAVVREADGWKVPSVGVSRIQYR